MLLGVLDYSGPATFLKPQQRLGNPRFGVCKDVDIDMDAVSG
jgi:hypothetical protein